MTLDLSAIREHCDLATPGQDTGHSQMCRCEECSALWQRGANLSHWRQVVVEQDVPALVAEVATLTADRDAAVAELAAWKRAETERVPQCFNCGVPCYFCLLYKTVLAECHEARLLVERLFASRNGGVAREEALFGAFEALSRWTREKAGAP